MNLSNFVAYVKQTWKNKPDTSTPLSAERLTHQEDGIKANSDAIQELAAAVVSQIVNNPDKIASMAALYAVDQKVAGLDGKIGDTSKLPAGTTDAVGAITQLYSTPHNRLSVAGIQYMLRQLGQRAGVVGVHPHRFRRTIATDLLNRGMPIEQVKEFLGHEKLDTTMIYCTVRAESVKASHRKYA